MTIIRIVCRTCWEEFELKPSQLRRTTDGVHFPCKTCGPRWQGYEDSALLMLAGGGVLFEEGLEASMVDAFRKELDVFVVR